MPIVRGSLVDQCPVVARGASQSSRGTARESSVVVCPAVAAQELWAIAVPCQVVVAASTASSGASAWPTMQVAQVERPLAGESAELRPPQTDSTAEAVVEPQEEEEVAATVGGGAVYDDGGDATSSSTIAAPVSARTDRISREKTCCCCYCCPRIRWAVAVPRPTPPSNSCTPRRSCSDSTRRPSSSIDSPWRCDPHPRKSSTEYCSSHSACPDTASSCAPMSHSCCTAEHPSPSACRSAAPVPATAFAADRCDPPAPQCPA